VLHHQHGRGAVCDFPVTNQEGWDDTPKGEPNQAPAALAAVSIENLQDFLLVGWGVERGGLEHLVAAEIPALHTLNHASATSDSVLKSSTYS